MKFLAYFGPWHSLHCSCIWLVKICLYELFGLPFFFHFFTATCNLYVLGNDTTKGEATSPDFPALQSSPYNCLLEFDTRSTSQSQYLELIFTDFILDNQDTVACHHSVNRLLYTVSVSECVNTTDIEGRSQTYNPAPCNGIVSHVKL